MSNLGNSFRPLESQTRGKMGLRDQRPPSKRSVPQHYELRYVCSGVNIGSNDVRLHNIEGCFEMKHIDLILDDQRSNTADSGTLAKVN